MYVISQTIQFTSTPSPYTWLLFDRPSEVTDHVVEQHSPEHFDNIYHLFLDRLEHLKRTQRAPKQLEKTELTLIFESLLEVKDAVFQDFAD